MYAFYSSVLIVGDDRVLVELSDNRWRDCVTSNLLKSLIFMYKLGEGGWFEIGNTCTRLD